MEPTIGMVIPIYTTRFINRLVGYMQGTVHRDDVTICVVNDGQREVSEFLSRQKYPDSVVVLNLPSQQGFSALNNFGWKNLTERFPTIQYLGTLNDDTIPKDGWLDELAVCLKKYPRTALSSPIMQVKRGPLRLNRSFATWRLKGSDEMEPVASKILSDTFVPVVSGFCFLARRDALEQVGYLDEQFRNGCEDVDLCLKLTSCGWRLVICSRSFVYHEEAKSRYLPGTGTNLQRNHAILANKWNHDVARFNKVQPKTIAFCIAYNQEHFIEAWVRNAAQYADELLVMFAPVAWTYNTAARRTIQPDKTLEILEELSKEFPKLTVVTGDWKDETQNRNDAVNIARKLGAGWLLIVDTDEFYYPKHAFHAYDWMVKNPSQFWWMHHVQFIKNIKWAIRTSDGNPAFQFAMDLNRVNKFKRMRIPDASESVTIPEEVCNCWHFSYLMPMDKLRQKFATYGHAKEVNPNWLNETWPRIEPGIENFHPINPRAWKEVKQVDLAPEVLQMFQVLRLPTTMDEETP